MQLASELLHAPISLVSLVGDEALSFLARTGLATSGAPREMAFCAHAIRGDSVFVVPDAALEAVMDLRVGNDQVAGHECPQALPLRRF